MPKMIITEVKPAASKYRKVALVGRVVTVELASIQRHEVSPTASDRVILMEAAQ